ncbi:MAG: hypothetical protein Q8P69_02255 [bacterium]|nr:hypothetical protein [bacterium]
MVGNEPTCSLAIKSFDGFYYARDTRMEIFNDVFFGQADDAPADRFKKPVFGSVFLDLSFTGMGLEIIAFYRYSPIRANGRIDIRDKFSWAS